MVIVPFSYLPKQFADHDEIIERIKAVVARGDYTLGQEVAQFERAFAARLDMPHAVGVNSGTDALFLVFKALGISGEVITTPYTFYATIATIIHAGGTPVFADVRDDFNIDPAAIEAAITPRTEAIVPVHWAGVPCDMDAIVAIATKHKLAVVEDAAHAFGSVWNGKLCGSFGDAAAFSMHPLKVINVWGDGGVIVTRDAELQARLRRLRNHGMLSRDCCVEWGYNSRLDTIQAVVGQHVLAWFDRHLATRVRNASYLDQMLRGVKQLRRSRPTKAMTNHYLYSLHAENRDQLVRHLNANDVEAKVHYPVPMHLQAAAADMGHKRGDFPVAEACADDTITLPAHEYITFHEIDFMAEHIRAFYGS